MSLKCLAGDLKGFPFRMPVSRGTTLQSAASAGAVIAWKSDENPPTLCMVRLAFACLRDCRPDRFFTVRADGMLAVELASSRTRVRMSMADHSSAWASRYAWSSP